jgi:hypothetical protein
LLKAAVRLDSGDRPYATLALGCYEPERQGNDNDNFCFDDSSKAFDVFKNLPYNQSFDFAVLFIVKNSTYRCFHLMRSKYLN